MSFQPHLALPFVSLLALAGCLSPDQRVDDFVGSFDTIASQVSGIGTTPAANMPTSSSATYDGFSTLMVYGSSSAQPVDYFVGRSEMTANFTAAGGTVEGRLDDFAVSQMSASENGTLRTIVASLDNSDASLQTLKDGMTDPQIASGALDIAGDISGSGYTGTISGNLTHGDTVTAVGGSMGGSFGGPTASAITIEGTTATGMGATQNGEARNVYMLGVGAR
ncbi:MAG: hypothetical protein VX874_05365 [Pseudomonadota bacterium]|nr:hypothetical protein [Pseudomonadota bacterium]